jgi:hypothetical protein
MPPERSRGWKTAAAVALMCLILLVSGVKGVSISITAVADKTLLPLGIAAVDMQQITAQFPPSTTTTSYEFQYPPSSSIRLVFASAGAGCSALWPVAGDATGSNEGFAVPVPFVLTSMTVASVEICGGTFDASVAIENITFSGGSLFVHDVTVRNSMSVRNMPRDSNVTVSRMHMSGVLEFYDGFVNSSVTVDSVRIDADRAFGDSALNVHGEGGDFGGAALVVSNSEIVSADGTPYLILVRNRGFVSGPNATNFSAAQIANVTFHNVTARRWPPNRVAIGTALVFLDLSAGASVGVVSARGCRFESHVVIAAGSRMEPQFGYTFLGDYVPVKRYEVIDTIVVMNTTRELPIYNGSEASDLGQYSIYTTASQATGPLEAMADGFELRNVTITDIGTNCRSTQAPLPLAMSSSAANSITGRLVISDVIISLQFDDSFRADVRYIGLTSTTFTGIDIRRLSIVARLSGTAVQPAVSTTFYCGIRIMGALRGQCNVADVTYAFDAAAYPFTHLVAVIAYLQPSPGYPCHYLITGSSARGASENAMVTYVSRPPHGTGEFSSISVTECVTHCQLAIIDAPASVVVVEGNRVFSDEDRGACALGGAIMLLTDAATVSEAMRFSNNSVRWLSRELQYPAVANVLYMTVLQISSPNTAQLEIRNCQVTISNQINYTCGLVMLCRLESLARSGRLAFVDNSIFASGSEQAREVVVAQARAGRRLAQQVVGLFVTTSSGGMYVANNTIELNSGIVDYCWCCYAGNVVAGNVSAHFNVVKATVLQSAYVLMAQHGTSEHIRVAVTNNNAMFRFVMLHSLTTVAIGALVTVTLRTSGYGALSASVWNNSYRVTDLLPVDEPPITRTIQSLPFIISADFIGNLSIHGNVLVGLLATSARFESVVEACAIEYFDFRDNVVNFTVPNNANNVFAANATKFSGVVVSFDPSFFIPTGAVTPVDSGHVFCHDVRDSTVVASGSMGTAQGVQFFTSAASVARSQQCRAHRSTVSRRSCVSVQNTTIQLHTTLLPTMLASQAAGMYLGLLDSGAQMFITNVSITITVRPAMQNERGPPSRGP